MNSSWAISNPKRWCCESAALNMPAHLQTQWDKKRLVFIPIPKKGNAKECSNYCTIAFISHASKVMLKILQVRLKQYMNCELPDIRAGFRKGRGTRDQIATSLNHRRSKRVPEKLLLLVYWLCKVYWLCHTMTVWITTNCGKFWKRWEYQTTLTASWEICMQVKKQQLEPDMEQRTASKLVKEYVKAVYCHPDYLNYVQCT